TSDYGVVLDTFPPILLLTHILPLGYSALVLTHVGDFHFVSNTATSSTTFRAFSLISLSLTDCIAIVHFHLPFASVVQWLREACQPARYLSVFAIWGVNADSTFMECIAVVESIVAID
ncbi:hypothetical protein ACJX0J_006416, partial [Zea mays]